MKKRYISVNRFAQYSILLSCLLSPKIAYAQAPEVNDLMGLSLKDLMSIKVEVASRHKEQARLAPSSVTIFQRHEILGLGVRSVEELLNFVPGFQTSRATFLNQGYRVAARGLVTGQPSYSVLFLMDGQRMNSDMSGGAMFDNRFITIANVDRVEVIRGPGSAMYGSSAFSGVVNIITTKDTNDAYVAVGDYGSREFYTNGSVHNNNWKASGFARLYKDDGVHYGADLTSQIDPSTTSTQDPYQGVDGKATISWNDRFHLDIRHSARDLDDFFNFNFVQNGTTHAHTEQNSVALRGDVVQSATWNLSANVNYSQWQEEQVEEFNAELGTYQYYSSEWNFELKANRNLHNHKIQTGIGYRHANIDKYRFIGFDSDTIYPQGPTNSREIFSLYAQDQYSFSDKLHGTLGMRLDKTTGIGADFNPRTALIFAPSPTRSFKLMYGEAFRAPNRLQTDDVYIGNPAIKSEKIRTLETAWLQNWAEQFNKNLSLQSAITLFISKHKNRISLKPGGGPFGLTLDNETETLTTSGLEMEMSARMGSFTRLRMAYTYLPQTEKNPQSFSTDTLSLIASYNRTEWGANLNAQFHSDTQQVIGTRANPSLKTLEPYWLLNASFYKAIYDNTKFIARAYNLTDATYYSPSMNRQMVTGVENRGRMFTLGVEVAF